MNDRGIARNSYVIVIVFYSLFSFSYMAVIHILHIAAMVCSGIEQFGSSLGSCPRGRRFKSYSRN